MEDHEREAAEKLFERMNRETAWLKQAYQDGDVREEYAELMNKHFEGMKQMGGLMFKLLHEFTPEETQKYEWEVKKIRELLTAMADDAGKFRDIHRRLPNKYDMFLATVEAPPQRM